MADQVSIRKGTSAELDAFTGVSGELAWDETNKRVRGFDGTQIGGFATARFSDIGSLGLQSANAVAITGGAADGLTLGGSVAAPVTATLLTMTTVTGTAGIANRIALASNGLFGLGTSSGSLDILSNNSLSIYITSATKVAQFTATGLNGCAIGAATASTIKGTVVIVTTSLNLPSYTVATLPAAGTAGRAVNCSNARMVIAGGSGVTIQAASAGTGGLVVDDGTAWRVAGTNIAAQA